MLKIYKNLVIAIAIIVVSLGFLTLFMLVDINLGPIKISSISTIMSEHSSVKKAQNALNTEQDNYKTTLKNLDTEKSSYKSEKQKYEAISDETVNVIKEATKQQNYSIEYMWIRLGNYAKTNNLSIVLVEPGGTAGSTGSGENTSTNTTTTPATKTATDTTTQTDKTAEQDTNKTAEQDANKTATDKDTSNKVPPANTDGNNTSTGTQTDNVLKIQVSGSYINVSDFIFEVENDKELRFKLDNISIEYVSGKTIKATFDVKNTIILK
ncbi:MAG: hypothetical protein PHP54_02310 [Clostridia bacterium]|nr:hypothetical protein [Clostridia bacterium]